MIFPNLFSALLRIHQTMSESNDYTLLIDDLPDSRDELVRVLVEEFGYHPTDARVRLRHLPGALPERFSRARASALAQRLQKCGCRASLIEQAMIPDLRHAAVLHHVRCVPPGLFIVAPEGHVSEVVPWSQLLFLSVGALRFGTDEQGHLDAHAGETHDPNVYAAHDHYSHEAWLALTDGRCVRFEEHQMNYEYLEERLASSGTVNFKLLIEDLVRFAPQLTLSASAKAFLSPQVLKDHVFESVEAFRELTAGQIALVRSLHSANRNKA